MQTDVKSLHDFTTSASVEKLLPPTWTSLLPGEAIIGMNDIEINDVIGDINHVIGLNDSVFLGQSPKKRRT